jgi:hypothetical protein
MLKKLIGKLGKLTDPRVAGRTSHPITNVMLIAFLATLSGESGWQAISDWGSFYAIELYRLLPSITSIPSADTFARVLAMVDPQEMAELTTSMASELLRRYRGNRKRGRPRKDATPELISIDDRSAKTLKSTKTLKYLPMITTG